MMNRNTELFTCFFLLTLLSITFGSSVRSSLTAEEKNSPFSVRKIDSIQQRYTRNGDPTQDTTQESGADLIEDTSNRPSMPRHEDLPPVLEGEKRNDKSIVLVNHRKIQSSSVAVAPLARNPERRLYYPSVLVDQSKYRLSKHHHGRASRETYYYHLSNNNSPPQPKHMGFPPVSNTRENLGKQINWNAKVGRAHRSFYDFLMA